MGNNTQFRETLFGDMNLQDVTLNDITLQDLTFQELNSKSKVDSEAQQRPDLAEKISNLLRG